MIVGMTLASVVIGPGMRSSCSARRSPWLSTSPFSAATTYGLVAVLFDTGALRLVRIQRVGVRLADDADARPARVTDQRGLGSRRRHRPAQERVGSERGPQRRRVVAELTDLRGLLVDERQHRPTVGVVRRDDRTVLEERVVAALGDERRERVGIDVVVPDVEVDAGRVATADFEAIDRRERLLGNEVGGHRRDAAHHDPQAPRPRVRSGSGRGGSPTGRRRTRTAPRSRFRARRRTTHRDSRRVRPHVRRGTRRVDPAGP